MGTKCSVWWRWVHSGWPWGKSTGFTKDCVLGWDSWCLILGKSHIFKRPKGSSDSSLDHFYGTQLLAHESRKPAFSMKPQ